MRLSAIMFAAALAVGIVSPASADAQHHGTATAQHERRADRIGPDGAALYLVGGPPPTLHCRPLQLCVIEAPEGESILDKRQSDSMRWQFVDSAYGHDGQNGIIVVKTLTGDIDGTGNKADIVFTTSGSHGVYHVYVVADAHARDTAAAGFIIPDEPKPSAALEGLRRMREQQRLDANAAIVGQVDAAIAEAKGRSCHTRVSDPYGTPVSSGRGVDFQPTDVFADDVGNTCLVMPKKLSSAPVVFGGANGDEMQRYGFRDGMYIIAGTPQTIVLLDGDRRVTLKRP